MIPDAAFMFRNVGLEFSLGFAYIAKATGEKVNYKLSMRRNFTIHRKFAARVWLCKRITSDHSIAEHTYDWENCHSVAKSKNSSVSPQHCRF